MIEAIRKAERRRNIFAASLKGIDLEHEEYLTKYKAVQKRADAKRQGLLEGEEEFDFQSATMAELGLEIEVEGE